jgi:fructose-1,6-bisphosphatase/inositol monophosphatase family enzyme
VIDQVDDLIREVAAEVIVPRFRHLSDGDVHEKAPGELVTIADQESERLLTAGLMRLLPGSVVVGEEAVAADPRVLDRLSGDDAVWLVDPVDGTSNFAAGREPFAVMVALVRDGVTSASWILDVVGDTMAVAERGAGAFVNGERVRTRTDAPPADTLTGAVMTRFLPDDMRFEVAQRACGMAAVLPGRHCAGYEYPAIVADTQQFSMFWRILPWDHVPGSLLVTEAGGVARHFDGTDHRPGDDRRGLLVAANEDIWRTARETLLP